VLRVTLQVLAGTAGVSAVAAMTLRGSLTWIPWWYAAILLGCAGILIHAAHSGNLLTAILGVGLLVIALPVPWETTRSGDSGTAWRLDGRIRLADQRIDPPGKWLWLTVGRPLTVGEILAGRQEANGSIRGNTRLAHRPALGEASAAVIGLRAAGVNVNAAAIVELSGPTRDDLPAVLRVFTVDGQVVDTVAAWTSALANLRNGSVIVSSDAAHITVTSDIGYRRVDIIERPDFDVIVGGSLARTPAGRWWRNQGAGNSHGVMVALIAYGNASGNDLARGRTVAGTGSIRADGSIGPIGGLRNKASAAARAGAHVLVFPESQSQELAGFDSGAMQLLGVSDISGAIAGLLNHK
jgi:hypothetical protein